MDGLVTQGASLLEVLEQTKNLAARDLDELDTNGASPRLPSAPALPPPPNVEQLPPDFTRWNEMK